MTKVENIGEHQFIQSVLEQQGLWVLMKDNSLYTLSTDGANSLATWGSIEQATRFSRDLEQPELKSIFVPLDLFLNNWLTSSVMRITEILASPKYGQPALTYRAQEFVDAVKT